MTRLVLFVSTTADDMLGERELVRQSVVSELAELAAQRGAALEVVELTWGEAADDLETLEKLAVALADAGKLHDADDVRCCFLWFVGERYGSVWGEFAPSVLAKFPDLKTEAGHSLLHVAIQKLVCGAAAQARQSALFLRGPRGVGQVPRSRRSDYVESDPQAQSLLGQLKASLLMAECPLGQYESEWDDEGEGCLRPEAGFEVELVERLAEVIEATLNDTRQRLNGADVRLASTKPAASRESAPRYLDENVQFTVYRPRFVEPNRWYPLLAFAHLSERPPAAPAEEPDPVAEVQRQARQLLADQVDDYQPVMQDSLHAVPREGELTLVPEMAGVTFNPPRRTFLWVESVQREEFRLKAGAELVGTTARGRMSIFLGSILLADVPLSIRVDATAPPPAKKQNLTTVGARPYRKIFASYSHLDMPIVEQFDRFAKLLGDEYLRDWTHLRSGQVWNDQLLEMIREADVFQLFWSSNSMRSPYVRQEWEFALSLGRPLFVRPTYWEDPLPMSPADRLPPDELQRLHFQRISLEGWSLTPNDGGTAGDTEELIDSDLSTEDLNLGDRTWIDGEPAPGGTVLEGSIGTVGCGPADGPTPSMPSKPAPPPGPLRPRPAPAPISGTMSFGSGSGIPLKSAEAETGSELSRRISQKLIEQLDLSKVGELDAAVLERELRAAAGSLCDQESTPVGGVERERVVREVLDELTGFGPISWLLRDATVREIFISGPQKVFVQRGGKLEPAEVIFRDAAHLEQLVERMAKLCGRHLDDAWPLLSLDLADGSRVVVVPGAIAADGLSVRIRRAGAHLMPFSAMLELGTFSNEGALLMEAAVKGRLNVLVCGEAESGKTSLLGALAEFIPESARIVSVERSLELQLRQPHVVRMATIDGSAGGRTLCKTEVLFTASQLRPDWLLVSGCDDFGPDAGQYDQGSSAMVVGLMEAGGGGALATLAARSPEQAVAKLASALTSPSSEAAERRVAGALDLIFFIRRIGPGKHRVESISEPIQGPHGCQLKAIICYEPDADGAGRFLTTGHRPAFADRLASAGLALPEGLFAARGK